jgi:hypothetical protein
MLIPLLPWLHAIITCQCPVSAHAQPSASGVRVIEFHVPENFQGPERRWLPSEARGKLVEFPARNVRKLVLTVAAFQ